MKKQWFRTTELIDEAYIMEAEPEQEVKRIRQNRRVLSVLASCACLALVLCNLWLFLPYSTVPPGTEAYKDSEYYPIIKELSLLTWEKPKYKNNFQMLTAELSGVFLAGAKDDVAPEDAANGGFDAIEEITDDGDAATGTVQADSTYQEITDNQVEGVTEADRIKRTDKHIYYLDGSTLRVFSIEGADSEELNNISLLSETKKHYVNRWELYLSEDGRTVTVIAMHTDEDRYAQVSVLSLDVSDPNSITEKNRLQISGNYLSSRMTGGKLLLMTEFVFNKYAVDFDEESTFLPQINGESIDPAGIVLPEEANTTRYTVVMKLDEQTLAMEGSAAFLSYSEDVYVSQDHIFLTNVFADVKKENGTSVRNAMTKITCLAYRDSFEELGSVTVRGYVKDQWSMDEYEGILRVVTTTNATTVQETYAENTVSADVLVTATGNSNASLYCIDLQSFEAVASVEDFAPPKEEVQSVRFDKSTAYVCTSIEMSDPVFFFDLSDLSNITYKDTGTIEGFSTSLVNFGDGFLLGIGREGWSTFKAEIYVESAEGVEGYCQYTAVAAYSTDYKSYYIDRENRLLGLGLTTNSRSSRYVLLHFDGYNLAELLSVELAGDNACKRGVYIDGFMYMLGEEDFKVEKVF